MKDSQDKVLRILQLTQYTDEPDALPIIYNAIFDYVAFGVHVTLLQSHDNKKLLEELQTLSLRLERGQKDSLEARQKKTKQLLKATTKEAINIERAWKNAKRETERRRHYRLEKHWEKMRNTQEDRITRTNSLASSDIDLPSPDITISPNTGQDYIWELEEVIWDLFSLPEIESKLQEGDIYSWHVHPAKTIDPKKRVQILKIMDKYISFLTHHSSDKDDVYPREFLLQNIEIQLGEKVQLLELIFQFELARQGRWDEVVYLQQAMLKGSGFTVGAERDLSHAQIESMLSIIDTSTDSLICAIQAWLTRQDKDWEKIYQQALRIHEAIHSWVSSSPDLKINTKQKIQLAIDVIQGNNFREIEKFWERFVEFSIGHLDKLIWFWEKNNSTASDIAFLAKKIFTKNQGKPNQAEKILLRIFADNARSEKALGHRSRVARNSFWLTDVGEWFLKSK